MNIRMRRGEFVMRGVRNAVVDQFDHAVGLLRHPIRDEPAHEVRKMFKRIRAGLRLLRAPLGNTIYRHLNRGVRDAGRLLTPTRDAKVMLETLDSLSRRVRDSHAAALRSTLLQERLDIRARLGAADIRRIERRLRAKRARLHAVSESRLDRADLDTALTKAYEKAYAAFKAAMRNSDDEHLHEWRKQVKYHFTQLEFVEPVRPKRFKAIIKRAHKLSDCLGADHDLAVLRHKIEAHAEAGKGMKSERRARAGSSRHVDSRRNDGSAERLLAELQRRRAKLQHKARELGKVLYSEKPRHGAKQGRWRANT